jgi:hypothetical protein
VTTTPGNLTSGDIKTLVFESFFSDRECQRRRKEEEEEEEELPQIMQSKALLRSGGINLCTYYIPLPSLCYH